MEATEVSGVESPAGISPVPVFSGLKKNAAPKLTMLRAAQLKPCDLEPVSSEPDAPTRPLLVYVREDGKQLSIPCTPQLYKVMKDTGLDMIDDSDFLIYVDRTREQAVRVERLVRQDFARNLIPTHLEGVKLIEFDVNLTEGLATVKAYPAKVDRELVLQIKQAIDAATILSPGEKLLDKYVIVDVRGGQGGALVTVNPFVK